MEFYCITTKKPDLHLQLTNHDIFPTLVEEQVFIICLRTNVCVQRYGGVLASYPDVSLSMKISSKGRREGENGLHLASCSFPWSIAFRHQFTLVSCLRRRQEKYFLCRCIKLFLKTWFYCHFLLRLT